jgi:hypothetical protein
MALLTMPSEMQYSEHAKIAYTSDWKTVVWEPKVFDSLTFKMSENTPASALPSQKDIFKGGNINKLTYPLEQTLVLNAYHQ